MVVDFYTSGNGGGMQLNGVIGGLGGNGNGGNGFGGNGLPGQNLASGPGSAGSLASSYGSIGILKNCCQSK